MEIDDNKKRSQIYSIGSLFIGFVLRIRSRLDLNFRSDSFNFYSYNRTLLIYLYIFF